MSKESYIRGFCKVAAAAGVDPVVLAKYAQQEVNVPENLASILKGYRSDIAHGLPQHVGPGISHATTSAPAKK